MLNKFKDLFHQKSNRLDVTKRFELERHAFTGTMSKFRVAREIKTGRRVGIKFLDKEKSALFNARFKGLNKPHEGEIGLRIHHPRIVTTFEQGLTIAGQEYILMEYIDGPGLNTLINERRPELELRRLEFIRQMAEAVQGVHDAGFIHRDICPRNFICNNDLSWLKLIDFGLTVPDEREYRLPGNRTGTPQYMAPEIVRRRATDLRVDVFSFGVSVYRLLTLKHPWGTTETTGRAALAHDTDVPTDIFEYRSNLDPRLAQAVHRCIEPNPEDRFSSIKQFLTAIRNVEQE